MDWVLRCLDVLAFGHELPLDDLRTGAIAECSIGRELTAEEGIALVDALADRASAGVKVPAQVKNVDKLDLRGMDLGAAGAERVVTALPAFPGITSINLLQNDIGIEAATKLVTAFRLHPTLKTLCGISRDQPRASFSGQNLTAADGMLIAADLEFNTSLIEINLQDNCIGKDGGVAIGNALKMNPVLISLNLANNRLCGVWGKELPGIPREGAYDPSAIRALVDVFKKNTALSEVDLRHNSMMYDEEMAVREAVRRRAELGTVGGFWSGPRSECTTNQRYGAGAAVVERPALVVGLGAASSHRSSVPRRTGAAALSVAL